jgi:uncharacterized membrane protein YbhN (UPF0104 family)
MAKVNKITKFWLNIIKTAALLILLALLYWQVKKTPENSAEDIVLTQPFALVLVVLLLPFNWLFEGLKWQVILSKIQKRVSFKTLLFSLFTGISSSLITPNRAGNFIGRMIWFGSAIRVQISVLSIYGNMAQWLSTVIFGAAAFFLANFIDLSEFAVWYKIVALLLVGGMVFLYFKPQLLTRFLGKWFYKRKMAHATRILADKSNLKWQLLSFSLMRYLIFSAQFVLVLYAFGVEPKTQIWLAVWLTYFIMTLVPSPLFSKVLIRENAALFVFGALHINEYTILISSLLLWFINLGIPAIIGGIIWLKWKPLS